MAKPYGNSRKLRPAKERAPSSLLVRLVEPKTEQTTVIACISEYGVNDIPSPFKSLSLRGCKGGDPVWYEGPRRDVADRPRAS